MLTKVNGFAFRSKIYYLCSTNVETPRRTGYLHVFYAKNRWEIGKITRRIRKNIRRKGKIVSNLVKIVSIVGKIMSILGARRSLIIYNTSSVNVKVS